MNFGISTIEFQPRVWIVGTVIERAKSVLGEALRLVLDRLRFQREKVLGFCLSGFILEASIRFLLRLVTKFKRFLDLTTFRSIAQNILCP